MVIGNHSIWIFKEHFPAHLRFPYPGSFPLPALICVLLAFQACDKDAQCGGGMCCAVSIWVKSIRICTPMGKVGDSCHPLTRKVSACAGIAAVLFRCPTILRKASVTGIGDGVLDIGSQRR